MMTQGTSAEISLTNNSLRCTSADLALLPESNNRYEIIDGELFVTRAPHSLEASNYLRSFFCSVRYLVSCY
jgi:hypothetical protein